MRDYVAANCELVLCQPQNLLVDRRNWRHRRFSVYLFIYQMSRKTRLTFFYSTRTLTLALWARRTAFLGAGKPLAFRQGVELRVNKHPLIVYFIDFYLQQFNFFVEIDR